MVFSEKENGIFVIGICVCAGLNLRAFSYRLIIYLAIFDLILSAVLENTTFSRKVVYSKKSAF